MSTVRVGDVILYHRVEHVVIFVNDCRALVIPLTHAVTWKDQPNGYTHFMAEGKGESISPTIEHEDLIRHLSVAEMKQHFSGVAASSAEATNTAELEKVTVMKKTNQTAATVAAVTTTTAPAPVKTGKGKRGKTAPTTGVVVPPTTPVIAAPAPKPSQKGTLIGRGQFVYDNAPKYDPANKESLAAWIKLIQAKWPVCGANWCTKHLRRALARRADKSARQAAVAEAAAEAAKKAKVDAEIKAKAEAEALKKAAAEAAKVEKAAVKAAKKNGKKAEAPKTETAAAA